MKTLDEIIINKKVEEKVGEIMSFVFSKLELSYVLEKFFGRSNVRTFEPDSLYPYPYYRIKRKLFDKLEDNMKRELLSYLSFRKFKSELTEEFLYIQQDCPLGYNPYQE